jgi:uncharacterized delta-60 repeat protein
MLTAPGGQGCAKSVMKNTVTHLIALWVFALGGAAVHGQAVKEAWVQRYSRAVETKDSAKKIAADPYGHVIVAGDTLTGATGRDWITVKYSADGVAVWTNRYNGPGNDLDFVKGLVADGSGNVFVTGESDGTNGFSDFATVAYSGTGVPLWTNRYDGGGGGDDQANAIALDISGNVIVTGAARSALFGPLSMVTIAYSPLGLPLWTNRYTRAASGDSGTDVVTDHVGNVLIAGYSSVSSSNSYDFTTVAYSGAGVPLWTNIYDGPGHGWDMATAIGVSASGDVFVAGHAITVSSAYAVLGYSGTGIPLWTNLYDPAPTYQDEPSDLAVDVNGNVFVTGRASIPGQGNDFGTVAYSGAGVPLWTNLYNASSQSGDVAAAILVDTNGNVIVSGYSSTSSNPDYSIIAYSVSGTPLWTNRYNGNGNGSDYASAMAMGSNGRVFVTGESVGAGSFEDFATLAYSDAGIPLWTNRYQGYGNSDDRASAVSVCPNGNVVIAGYACSTYFTHSPPDFVAIAYSPLGTPIWTNVYDGPWRSDDRANALAVDSTGNVIIAGHVRSTNLVGNFYPTDYATVAYSGAGVPLWTNLYSGPGNYEDVANVVVVDSGGNVFVSGNLGGFYNGFKTYDMATVAYSGAGVPLWTNRYASLDGWHDLVNAMAVDAAGNVFVSGSSLDDYATIAYSGAGVPLWTNFYNGPGGYADQANAVTVGTSGNVFVTGNSRLSSGGLASDYATIANSGAGVPLWTNRYNGTGNYEDNARAVAVGTNGNVYVSGYSYGSGGNYDYATVAYSEAGLPLWTNRYNGPGNRDDRANAVVVDANGYVFVSGYSYSGSTNDFATVVYSGAGVPLSTNRYNGPAGGEDIIPGKQSLAVAPDGVVLAGYSDGDYTTASTYDFATIKYIAGGPVITSQPQGVTNLPGSPVLFLVAVDGSPTPTLQWRFNGGVIPNATNSTYAIPSVNYGDAGDYDVIASNSLGSATSVVAQLAVQAVGFNKITTKQLGIGQLEFSYVGLPGSDYVLERSFSLSPPVQWGPQLTNPAGLDAIAIFTNSAIGTTNNFWRIRSMP